MLTTNLIRLVLLRMTSIFEDLYTPGLHWTIPAVRASTNADFVEGPRKTVTRRGQDGLHFHRRIFAMLVSLSSAHHPQTPRSRSPISRPKTLSSSTAFPRICICEES
jgi:hypothetical protein